MSFKILLRALSRGVAFGAHVVKEDDVACV
jgi:hypothetical protein